MTWFPWNAHFSFLLFIKLLFGKNAFLQKSWLSYLSARCLFFFSQKGGKERYVYFHTRWRWFMHSNMKEALDWVLIKMRIFCAENCFKNNRWIHDFRFPSVRLLIYSIFTGKFLLKNEVFLLWELIHFQVHNWICWRSSIGEEIGVWNIRDCTDVGTFVR